MPAPLLEKLPSVLSFTFPKFDLIYLIIFYSVVCLSCSTVWLKFLQESAISNIEKANLIAILRFHQIMFSIPLQQNIFSVPYLQ